MFWSGFIVEEVLGGFGQDYAWNPRTRVWSCETLFTKLNEWGAPLPTLRKLLRSAEAEELIEAQLGVFRQDYERAEERPPQRAFRMKLATRVRFHLGASLHRLCFRSWPLLPILDRRLLDVLFNAPAEMLQDRRLEKDLLVRRFPVLARIPWEHNSFRLVPLQATGLCRIPLAQPAVTALRTKARRWYWQQWRKSEPRRYYRCYDLDGPWWRAVRAEAEAYRDRLDEWLDRPALDSLLPPPHVELRSRNPFSEGATQRLLLGLLLWTAPRDG
jgi:asparagine synthase (glutamine-hydrolysing)